MGGLQRLISVFEQQSQNNSAPSNKSLQAPPTAARPRRPLPSPSSSAASAPATSKSTSSASATSTSSSFALASASATSKSTSAAYASATSKSTSAASTPATSTSTSTSTSSSFALASSSATSTSTSTTTSTSTSTASPARRQPGRVDCSRFERRSQTSTPTPSLAQGNVRVLPRYARFYAALRTFVVFANTIAPGFGDELALLAQEKLGSDTIQPLRIVVIAPMNAGKSTFVSALGHWPILDVRSCAATLVLWCLQHDPDPCSEPHFVNAAGPRGSACIQERILAVNEAVRAGAAAPAALAVIHADNVLRMHFPFLARIGSEIPCEIVDTPGPDECGTGAARAAQQLAVRLADVVLIMLDYTRLGGDNNKRIWLDVLQSRPDLVANHFAGALFIVNKFDAFRSMSGAHDEQATIKLVQHEIHRWIGASPPADRILLVSAQHALVARAALGGRLGTAQDPSPLLRPAHGMVNAAANASNLTASQSLEALGRVPRAFWEKALQHSRIDQVETAIAQAVLQASRTPDRGREKLRNLARRLIVLVRTALDAETAKKDLLRTIRERQLGHVNVAATSGLIAAVSSLTGEDRRYREEANGRLVEEHRNSQYDAAMSLQCAAEYEQLLARPIYDNIRKLEHLLQTCEDMLASL